MKKLGQSSRARGPLRGGVGGGGGYEQTDPDYDSKRLRQLKADYESLKDKYWRAVFLRGLSKYEQDFVVGKVRET